MISEEMRKRIKLVLQTKDPDIIYDLRINNGFQGTKFNDFWDAMQEYFNDVCIKHLLIKCYILY
jgi:hypothetical protein